MKNLNHRVISQYILAVFFFAFVLFFGFKNINLIAKALQSANKGAKAEALIDGIEAGYTDEFYRKHNFVDAYGLVSNLMQRRSLNERIKLSNGQLDTVYEWGSLDDLCGKDC